MKKILIAVTAHNEPRHTLHKTLRSVTNREIIMPEGWVSRVVCFTWKDVPLAAHLSGIDALQTGEETLGGKRNAAVAYARSNGYDLIAFCDGDDLFGPSWIPGLCYQHDIDVDVGQRENIYHPQWNVLFDPRAYVVREHFASNDPRFDSRDMMFYNPWSALCAFKPMWAKHKYRCHKISDPRLSFEDWSFNLDTWCDGQEHIVVPDTHHFLRMRHNSLGKSTIFNTLEHTRYFKDPAFIQKKTHTQSNDGDGDLIDHKKLKAEMESIGKIDPLIYYWHTNPVSQQVNTRADKVADKVCEVAKQMSWARDVFWMRDHKRIGGAEKALGWVSEFLLGFGKGLIDERGLHQVWVDDVSVDTGNAEEIEQWRQGITHLLRIWTQEGYGRSLHICNTSAGWRAIVTNPALFDGIQIYLYAFNDDLLFPRGSSFDSLAEAGYRAPLYAYADVLDRPNVHIITDSDHYGARLADLTGLGDKIREIAIPAEGLPNKRKKTANGVTDILWAGRFDYFKGVDEMLDASRNLGGGYLLHVFGDGPQMWTDKLIDAAGRNQIRYGGRYANFAEIPNEYDFFLFTSEREGAPNVVREAMASGLPVLARKGPWMHELPLNLFEEYEPGKIVQAIEKFELHKNTQAFSPPEMLSRDFCETSAIAAFKECLI
jgi:glycosyltransferase involved in cell wall biosynthesis